MKLKVSRGTITVGPYWMASGSGGGSGGPPPKPKAPIKPFWPSKGPKWLQVLVDWLKAKLGK